MGDQRIADYFIVTGLPPNPILLENATTNDSQHPKSNPTKTEPITDICIIIPEHGEECPPGYKVLVETPTGLMADLNHGSIRSSEVFICYRRGRDKPPLTDIGVLYEGSERVLPGCEVVYTTPYGRPANINNSTNQRIYLTYRRAVETASSDTLTVTDICVIITNKGEHPPHSFCKIDKNLNKGTLMGSNVYICYKKSMSKDYSIAYKPGVLSRYPEWDWPDFPLPEDPVAMFALTMGAVLESWLEQAQHPKPVFSTFALTGVDYKKMYGAAVTFYEPYPIQKLDDTQKTMLGLHLKKKRKVYVNRAICILSKHPFFEAFKEFLNFLWKKSISDESTNISLEKVIGHLMWSVPFPSPERPRVMVQLSMKDEMMIALPDDSPIPHNGASFSTMLRNLASENTVNLLSYVLLEHKIVIHSLRPAVLTGVIEAVGSMIFPFQWQCPYIPLCPLGLSEVLTAPCPFIVGVDSRYFDLFDPPSDVTCIDLDTCMITQPIEKAYASHKFLPKRPTKVLRATLDRIYYEMRMEHERTSHTPSEPSDIRRHARQNALERSIQEAFLRFMASILKGYSSYLLPISGVPTFDSTNVKELFDMKGFLKSRDKTYHRMYEQMLSTQTFTRFIEERSFNIRDDSSLDFFDECTEKVDENLDTPQLLVIEPFKSDHTAFIPPPTPDDAADNSELPVYQYSGFPDQLHMKLFPYKLPPPSNPDTAPSSTLNSDKKKAFLSRRSKAEIKQALKAAHAYKTGLASPSLWAKCLSNHSFSLWFIHLPALVYVSKSANCSLRAAFIILEKMREYRLNTPEEVCYRTMMNLCGVHRLPILAVKLLCEMRIMGVNINAVTYGFYNQAVLESAWPAESANAKLLWRKVRNLVHGVARFKQPLKKNKRRYSKDQDSLGRDSMESNEIVVDLDLLKREDCLSSDKGYSSMSQEDIRREQRSSISQNCRNSSQSDDFRNRVGSIIRRSFSITSPDPTSPTSCAHLRSSAGVLISTTTKTKRFSFSGTVNTPLFSSQSLDANRKRHRSAGERLKGSTSQDIAEDNSEATVDSLVDTSDPFTEIKSTADNSSANESMANESTADESMTKSMRSVKSSDSLKKITVVADDPLGLFSDPDLDMKNSTPKTTSTDIFGLTSDTKTTSPPTTMEIGNLFGRDSSPKKTPTSSKSSDLLDEARRYNLLELSPEDEFPSNNPNNPLRKSISLDSRNSYKSALQDDVRSASYVNNGAVDGRYDERASIDSKGSLGSGGGSNGNISSQNSPSRTGNSSYKSWVTSSIKKSANLALKSNLSVKVKDMVYGKSKPEPLGSMSSRESLTSVGSGATPYKQSKSVGGHTTTSLSKIKSASNSMAKHLVSNYNKIKHTVKEYQSPSTVSAQYKQDHRSGDSSRNIHNNVADDNISLLSDQLSTTGVAVYTGADDSLSLLDDKGKNLFDTAISFGDVSSAFISQYTYHDDLSKDVVDSNTASVSLQVTMCTLTTCDHCAALLYDEDIMAGWSAQDSDLNTTCQYCEKKTVPSLHIELKDRSCCNLPSVGDTNIAQSPTRPPSSIAEDLIRVHYLSPLVLRKELENVLENEGDISLTKSIFIDQHPDIYWNLVWYFQRLRVPSHLPEIMFSCERVVNLYKQTSSTPLSTNNRLHIRTVWNLPKLHEKMAQPMYSLWKETEVKSSVIRALLTEESHLSKPFMQQIITCVECNDMYTPLKLILNNRKQKTPRSQSNLQSHSAYRDILFLAFTHFGRENMDHDAFDREYKLAFKKLCPTDRQYLQPSDFPPSSSVIWCRKLFGCLYVT